MAVRHSVVRRQCPLNEGAEQQRAIQEGITTATKQFVPTMQGSHLRGRGMDASFLEIAALQSIKACRPSQCGAEPTEQRREK